MNLDTSAFPKISLAGFDILSGTTAEVSDLLYRACEERRKVRLFFANSNLVVQCRHLHARIAEQPVCIINDGIALEIAARLVHREGFKENLNGSDFIPRFCRGSPRPLRFFLIGSQPGIAERAARRLVEEFGQQIAGTCDGYAQFRQAEPALPAQVNASGADVVLVAFGNPLQEQWILDHGDEIEAPVMMGVGAFLEFLSGSTRRAPRWMRALRLEWLFRLSREPRRLLKRYSVDMLGFLWICVRTGNDRAIASSGR